MSAVSAPVATVTDAHHAMLSRVKIKLMETKDAAFFTTLCFSMKHVWDDGPDNDTAACDGHKVYWNPTFFMDQLVDIDERLFVMIHEVMHPALMHLDPVRSLDKDPDLWNIACDHVINLMLIDRGFKMPTKIRGHADPRFRGMSAEEVYKILKAEASGGGGKPAMVDLRKPQTKEEEAKLREHIQDIVVQASIASRSAGDRPGSIPGEIEIMLERLLNPKLPFGKLLRNWFQSFAKNDFSMKRPNRRFFPKHYLPSLWSESLMDFACAIDVSGSTQGYQFQFFVSELAGIFRTLKPQCITLLLFDTDIKSVHRIHSVEELKRVEFTGLGGTRIQPVIDWANENKPQGMLVFSDGEFRWPGVETKVPTVWVIHDDPSWTAPFGRVITYEMPPEQIQ